MKKQKTRIELEESRILWITLFICSVIVVFVLMFSFTRDLVERDKQLSECQDKVPKDIIMVCNNSISSISNIRCDSMKVIKLIKQNCEFYNFDFKYINTTRNCEVIE